MAYASRGIDILDFMNYKRTKSSHHYPEQVADELVAPPNNQCVRLLLRYLPLLKYALSFTTSSSLAQYMYSISNRPSSTSRFSGILDMVRICGIVVPLNGAMSMVEYLVLWLQVHVCMYLHGDFEEAI